jgi:AraC-like DNA-binding protein
MTHTPITYLSFEFARITPPIAPGFTSAVGYYVFHQADINEYHLHDPDATLQEINETIAEVKTQFHYSENKVFSLTLN